MPAASALGLRHTIVRAQSKVLFVPALQCRKYVIRTLYLLQGWGAKAKLFPGLLMQILAHVNSRQLRERLGEGGRRVELGQIKAAGGRRRMGEPAQGRGGAAWTT